MSILGHLWNLYERKFFTEFKCTSLKFSFGHSVSIFSNSKIILLQIHAPYFVTNSSEPPSKEIDTSCKFKSFISSYYSKYNRCNDDANLRTPLDI